MKIFHIAVRPRSMFPQIGQTATSEIFALFQKLSQNSLQFSLFSAVSQKIAEFLTFFNFFRNSQKIAVCVALRREIFESRISHRRKSSKKNRSSHRTAVENFAKYTSLVVSKASATGFVVSKRLLSMLAYFPPFLH